ncbi:MAG: type pantothenate kinase [Chthoniobacter sp.]|jgi:type III pantothenate kinase|nr:type pantothenate kinase [Chthoniobacter sp.]
MLATGVAAEIFSLTNSGQIMSLGCTTFSRTSSRNAGEARSRRGRFGKLTVEFSGMRRQRYTSRLNSQSFLLIDISNSFTKFAVSSRERLGRVSRIATQNLDARTFARFRGAKVVLSSVVPDKARLVRKTFEQVVNVSARVKLGVGIDYPKPLTIGADRLANAVSATAIFGAPVVVVDFGTAVTFDIISPAKTYVGGVIAPGLEAMTDYLFQRTALLPKIKPAEPGSVIGKSTRAAMNAGAVFGYRGLVKQILTEIKRELGAPKLRVVATGGYADLIARKLPEIEAVHPHLTLEGLRIIGTLNFPL